MIRLFRQLRLRLLSQKRFRNYAGYAVGEIVLVVLGILIALQINSYYEGIKQEQLTANYVDLIVKDLQKDLANIDSLTVFANNNIRNAETYFKYFDTQQGASMEELIDSVQKVEVSKFRYIPVDFTFRDMQFSGNTALLTDSQRAALADLLNIQEFFQIVNEKSIVEAMENEKEMRSIWPLSKYADHLHMNRLYDVDFFQQTGIPLSKKEQQQYLIHAQNVIALHANLGRNMLWMKEEITRKTNKALTVLEAPQE